MYLGSRLTTVRQRHEPFSTPVKTSPPQALLSASSWTGDITLAEAGVAFLVTACRGANYAVMYGDC